MRFLPLIAATYFMVSGGPYGIEDILGGAGFAWAIVILLVLPVRLEPAHGADDRRTGQRDSGRGRILRLGSARAGPVLGLPGELAFAFRQHLRHGHLSRHLRSLPGQVQPHAHRRLARLRVVAGGRGRSAASGTCGARLPSARAPSASSFCCSRPSPSSWCSGFGMDSPVIPRCSGLTRRRGAALSTAILVAMWNYMGWDNASTVAQEVENPQRNYPIAP